MTIRKLDAGRGAGWITDGLAVFKANPGPYLTACVVVGLISSLPLVGIFFGLFMPVMYGGLLSLLHHQARGEPTSTGQIFDGFQQPGALSRLIPIVLVNLAIAFVLVIILAVTIGVAVFQLIKASQAHQQPDPQLVLALLPKFALLLLILLPIGVFFGWVMMLAIPRAMLGNVPGMDAMREAVRAVLSNFLPLLVNLLCLSLLMFVIILIMMIPFMLLGLVQQHSFFLGMLIQIPVMAVFTGGIIALYCAVMYQAWREVFEDETALPPPPPAAFEA
jgi:hypothetical protein